ncbi:OLC1v1026657C1 [Oldenlandia corymbosa var. corymbosa]|uniref:CDP-diacylglycerol--inositol 3-phosphatidyltransferase n=1 Tax=Oldenlandia corymbosa var. corymbosa TaxID=529605 RepID=A0AAV1C7J2_OLDCO|nr:OLC1v1026657C1 [Oldenlandia corymbosa var. corymbosa]
MADNRSSGTKVPTTVDVYLYIPNIIGYIRILMNCVAFAICFQNKILFSFLYLISFVCDALDGHFARKFNQVSTFGAVLDMVTDRVSTACLLLILSQVYRPGLIFLFLLALDIGSHWFQMYSTFLLGKTSHKDVKDSTSWLFRAYYGNKMFMGFCCVSCEVLYIMLFLLAETQIESLRLVLANAVRRSWITAGLLGLLGFGWGTKQLVNLIQMKTAADVCVLHDINNKKKQ